MREVDGRQALALARAHALDPDRMVFLDVREPWEVATASIACADADPLLIPMGRVVDRVDELDPLQPVVCICHHGARSAQVVAFLERRGFDAVYNLAGGIDAWSREVDPGVPRY